MWNCSVYSYLLYRKTRQKARIKGVEKARFLRGKIVNEKGTSEKAAHAVFAERLGKPGIFAEKEGLSTEICTLWKKGCGIS